MYIARFTAFTTPCEIQIDVSSQQEGEKILSFLLMEIRRLQSQYSFFEATSQIYAINHRTNDTLTITQELSSILNLSLFYTKMTHGTFDIALAGTLKQAYQSDSLLAYQQRYEALCPFASSRFLTLEGLTLHFSNSYTQIDLGGIVKEYAVDQTILLLQELGIASALVNFGGDVAVYGTCDDQPWRIGIQDPKNPDKNVTSRELHNASLCTSGHSKRYTSIEERRFSHIIAPHTQAVPLLPPSQISIMAPTTVDAGIWSTALLINPSLCPPSHITSLCVWSPTA